MLQSLVLIVCWTCVHDMYTHVIVAVHNMRLAYVNVVLTVHCWKCLSNVQD